MTHRDEPTEMSNVTQLYGAFQRLSTHCFGFTDLNFTVLVHSNSSPQQTASPLVLPSTRQQTDKVSF